LPLFKNLNNSILNGNACVYSEKRIVPICFDHALASSLVTGRTPADTGGEVVLPARSDQELVPLRFDHALITGVFEEYSENLSAGGVVCSSFFSAKQTTVHAGVFIPVRNFIQ